MRTIAISQSNLIADGQNNKFIYKFPNSILFKDNSIAVSSIAMYFSWFNISNTLSNTSFIISLGIANFTITLPEGIYEISTINAFLQSQMINAGIYLVDANGNNVYYVEMILNPTRYAVQINTFAFPSSLPTGYTNPSGIFPFATQPFTNATLTFSSRFNEIVGYPANFQTASTSVGIVNTKFVSTNSLGTISYLSTVSPNVQPNSSLFISISGINNPYALPSSIIYSITPNVASGQLINEKPPNFAFNKMIDGTYSELRLTILGTDLSPIQLNDPSTTILLVIKDKDEMLSK